MFIITGGGTGIGSALAYTLAKDNHRVLIIGRREEPLQKTAKLHPNIASISADLTRQEDIQKIAQLVEKESKIQGLIHNAGTIEPILPIQQIPKDAWRHTMAVNVEPALFLTQALLSQLKHGRVLNISSGAAHFPVSAWAPYCVSKAALSMLTLCWQQEIKETYFASVMPGIIDTDMQAFIRHADYMDADKLQFFLDLKQQNRLITPETVALFLKWLLVDLTPEAFQSKEWDIYEQSHHSAWLESPHVVPSLENE